jgi:hypothetical protein
MVSLLLACLPFSPDWATNVFPSRERKAGTALGDAVALTAPASTAVTEIRAIAMAADKVEERGAIIFGFSVRENHFYYLARCGLEQRGFVFPSERGSVRPD